MPDLTAKRLDVLDKPALADPAERFIAAATRTMADNAEIQFAARQQLAATLGQNPASRGDSLELAAQRLEQASAPGKKSSFVFYGCLVVASLIALLSSRNTLRDGLSMQDPFGGLGVMAAGPSAGSKAALTRGLTPQQQLLLVGDLRQSSPADQSKALWDSDPANPAYYADYVAAYLSEHQQPPSDLLEVAARLDPENAYFTIQAAAALAKEALSKSAAPTTSTGLKLHSVVDPAKLDEAIALLRLATAQPHWNNYQAAMLRERIPLLPKVSENTGRIVPLTYLAQVRSPVLQLVRLIKAIERKAFDLAAAGDTVGFNDLVHAWEKLCLLYATDPEPGLIDILVAQVFVYAPAKTFEQSANDLGMPELAARMQRLGETVQATKHRPTSPADPDFKKHGSLLAALTLPTIQKIAGGPAVSPEDFQPGRLADHATFGRLAGLGTWLLLGLCALAALLFRFRGSLLARRLSQRMLALLGPRDWLWIIGAGALVPVLYYQLIYRLTPFGGRDFALGASGFAIPLGQWAGLALLLIALPILVARWRLTLRAGAAGLASNIRWPLPAAAVGGMLALPLIGATLEAPSLLLGCSILMALLLLAILIVGFRALLGRWPQLVRRMTLARAILPAYATAMFAMATTTLICQLEERHWVALDHLMEITAEAPAMSRYEYQAAQLMRQDLIDILTSPR